MNLRRNIIMLVALLGLGTYIYFVEFAKQQETEEAKKMLSFDPADVTAVELIYPDRQLQLRKKEEEWAITQPIEAKADTTAVDNLVKAVNSAEVSRTLEEVQEDMALYGLNEPVVKVKLTLKDGDQLPQLTIGKDTPVGHSVYVQRAGEKDVLLTPQSFRLGMTKETKDLRDRNIIDFDKDAVQLVTLTRPSHPQGKEAHQASEGTTHQDSPATSGKESQQKFQAGIIEEDLEDQDAEIILRKADLGWAMDKPISTRADDAIINTFLSSLSGLRAQDFVDEPLLEHKEFGLDPPHLSIALTLGEDKTQHTILVGNEKEVDQGAKQRYVKRADDKTLFLVGDWVFRDLNKTSRDFRDKTVAPFAKNAVARVEVQRHDGDGFQLTKNAEAAWRIDSSQEDPKSKLKENALGQFVTDLHELKGFEIVADDPSNLQTYGLRAPLVTIRAYNDAEEKLAGLLIGETKDGETTKIFAMPEDGGSVFGLRDYVFDRLNKKPADFWEKPAEENEKAGAESETKDDLEEEHM